MITQSVGVPRTAKWRGPTSRRRKRIVQRQRMRDAGLIELRRHDPDVVGQRARDLFDDLQARGMDAVVIGAENSHPSKCLSVRVEAGFCLWASSYPAIAAEANRPVFPMFAASSRHARDERIWRSHRTACGNPLPAPAMARRDRALWTAAGNTAPAVTAPRVPPRPERACRVSAAHRALALPASQPAEAAQSARSPEPARLPAVASREASIAEIAPSRPRGPCRNRPH